LKSYDEDRLRPDDQYENYQRGVKRYRHDDDDDDHYKYSQDGYRKKKRGFFNDLFDFD